MVKLIITRKSDDVIVNIVDTAEVVSNGLKVTEGQQEYIIGLIAECNQYDNVETPDTIKIQQYKYTPAGGFVLNPDYVEYKTPEQEIAELKASKIELEQQQAAMSSDLQAFMDYYFANNPTV